MSGMDSLGKVWDGYEWVIPDAPPPPNGGGSTLAEPTGRKFGLARDAYLEQIEERRKVVALQREVGAMRAQRARIALTQRKNADVEAFRREHDKRSGREAVNEDVERLSMELAKRKVEPADGELLDELALQLNEALAADAAAAAGVGAASEAASEHALLPRESSLRPLWIQFFKAMDEENTGRVNLRQFKSGVLAKLRGVIHASPNRRRRRTEMVNDLRSIWCALDRDVDEECLRGWITVVEFTGFMRRGVPPSDERPPAERAREMRAARQRTQAPVGREQLVRKPAHATAGAVSDDAAAGGDDEWRRPMERVAAATETQLTKLATRLTMRLETKGHKGWYDCFKYYDTDCAGRLGWSAFCLLVRELLGTTDLQLSAAGGGSQRVTTVDLREQVRRGAANGGATSSPQPGATSSSPRSGHAHQAHELDQMRSVWRALDRDLSGHITVGDFSGLMKLGAPPPPRRREPPPARESPRAPHMIKPVAVREAVQQADGKYKSAQDQVRMSFEAARTEEEHRAQRLKEELKLMKYEDEVRAYRMQKEALSARLAGGEKTHQQGPTYPAGGSKSARGAGGGKSRFRAQALPPLPKTERSLERREAPPREMRRDEQDAIEYRRMMSTFRRVQQRMGNGL